MAGTPHVLVAGLESLGVAIVERLVRDGARVTVLALASERDRFEHQVEPLGVTLVTGSPAATGNLVAAGCEDADVLVLAGDDDSTNVDAALAARRLRPSLPLVVRVFDSALAGYLEQSLAGVTVLSMSAAAAPVFAEMALTAIEGRPSRATAIARRARTAVARGRRVDVDRVLVIAILAFAALVLTSSFYFARVLKLRLLDAAYFVWTTVFTVGYGDISLYQAPDEAKAVGMALMFAGAALMAIFYALLSGWVVARRLDVRAGRVAERGHGHVVVAGAGNIGFRVARILAGRGLRCVVVERDADSHNAMALRAEGHHVIIADASLEETLALAGVDGAVAVLALTDADAVNLSVALAVRGRARAIPVVVRLGSAELAAHVGARGDALAASSVTIAGEAFARAALAAC
ncbi:MAG TPA: NAD-binding protein [Methylomirabilota bacterium]|jgi:Trk K+ transport system NAD-binding subunit|nr:NAD-binding protein [Methylomirabilota bacterium]